MIPSYFGSKHSINNVVACPVRSMSEVSALNRQIEP